jgi:hypothetical protein
VQRGERVDFGGSFLHPVLANAAHTCRHSGGNNIGWMRFGHCNQLDRCGVAPDACRCGVDARLDVGKLVCNSVCHWCALVAGDGRLSKLVG